MVDTYEAKFDYERERDDVLSFNKGEHFEIVNKTNDKWWVAKRLSDGTVGYVPSIYLQLSNYRVIGKLVPEKRRNTKEHDIHLQALAELHRKVRPLPEGPMLRISPYATPYTTSYTGVTPYATSYTGVSPYATSYTGVSPYASPYTTSYPGVSPYTTPYRPTSSYTASYVMWQKHVQAHVIGATLSIPIPSSDEDDEEEDLPAHQRKSAPAAVPTFLKVFNPAEIQPQRRSYSGRGSVSPSPPSPTPRQTRSKSWRGDTTTTTPSPSSSSSQPFLRSPTAEHKLPPGVSRKPPVAAPKKPPVSPLSSFEFKPPPKFTHTAPPTNNNNTTSNGTPYHHQFPPPPSNVPPPEPDYDRDDDEDDVIPYHHKLNSSGRISSLSSDEANDLPSPSSPSRVHGKSPLDLQHPSAEEERLIQPKPLPNPVKSSRNHQQLHRDLRISIKTHGEGKVPIDSKPELAKKFRERKMAEKEKEMNKEKESRRTSMEVKLMERLKMEDEDTKKKDASLHGVKEQPEFMKVRLKHTSTPSKT